MDEVYSTPQLQSTTSKGLSKYWVGSVVTVDGQPATTSETWQELASGGESKRQFSEPRIIEAKNVGRSNETSTLEQARLELDATEVLKRKSGYHEEGEKPDVLPLPMLAHSFDKRKHNITYPAYVQVKLDGVRCLSDGEQSWSRTGNLFDEQVVSHLQFNTGGVILDGELMLPHEEYTFQETISAVKKFRPVSKQLIYFVYDIIDPTLDFISRKLKLEILSQSFPESIRLVPTNKVDSEEAVSEYHDFAVSKGFEGCMARNTTGKYKLKSRSADLQKVKIMKDSEFKVIGYEEGTAKFTGTPIFVCVTPTGDTFKVTPKGKIPDRKQMWVDRETYINKMLTVQFQELTDSGIPRFPIGISFRDYE